MRDTTFCYNNQTTNLNEFSFHEITVNPNPVSNVVNIIAYKQNIRMIQVTDISGHIVYEINDLNDNHNLLSLKHLPTGVYFMQISNDMSKRFANLHILEL